jgi:hypothetical protein
MYYASKENDSFDIIEKETDMKIVLQTSKLRAQELCKKLNKGSGFKGFTPDFFAKIKGHEMGDYTE